MGIWLREPSWWERFQHAYIGRHIPWARRRRRNERAAVALVVAIVLAAIVVAVVLA
jgi:hypothetical protein